MEGSISGYLKDAIAGEILLSSRLSLTRRGVPGESYADVDEQGRFFFRALAAGSYCIGVDDDRYAPIYHRLAIEEDETVAKDLLNSRMAYVAVSRGAEDAQLYTNDRAKLPEALGHDVTHESAHTPAIKPEQSIKPPQPEITPVIEHGMGLGHSL